MTTGTPAPDGAVRAVLAPRPRLNWPLVLIAVSMAPVGVQAALFPRSFFDDFPAGRGWIAATGGAYDEHLTRDVGVLFVSLVIVTAWTARTRSGDRAVAVAWIVQGVAHLAFHATHLDGLGGADQAALLASLAAVPALAIAACCYPNRPAGR